MLIDVNARDNFVQRESPSGNYQIDEDVWARHPTDGIMYIASVIDINSFHHTCRVMFFNDDQSFNLDMSQLRHVTLEEIQRNRYVDYERGWSDNMTPGLSITYNRYGDQLSVEYTGTAHDDFTGFLTTEQWQFLEDDRTDHRLLSSSETEDENITLSSHNESTNEPTSTHSKYLIPQAFESEAFRRLLPIFLEEMDTSQLLDIWPDLDIHLIEQSRQHSSSYVSSTSYDDTTPVVNEQPLLSHEVRGNQPDIIAQAIQFSAPFHVVNDVQADKSSQKLFDQQLIVNRTRDENHQSLVVPMALINLPAFKDAGTQTESFTSLSMVPFNRSFISTDGIPSDQLTKYSRSSKMGKKASTSSWSLRCYSLIQENIMSIVQSNIDKRNKFRSRFRFAKLFSSDFTKSRSYVILAIVIIYYLLNGSIIKDTNVNSEKHTMIFINLIRHHTVPLVFCSGLLLAYVVNGPGESPPTLWWYALAVP